MVNLRILILIFLLLGCNNQKSFNFDKKSNLNKIIRKASVEFIKNCNPEEDYLVWTYNYDKKTKYSTSYSIYQIENIDVRRNYSKIFHCEKKWVFIEENQDSHAKNHLDFITQNKLEKKGISTWPKFNDNHGFITIYKDSINDSNNYDYIIEFAVKRKVK